LPADPARKNAVTCADLLVQVATAAIDRQLPDGSMPAGHNGPYGDLETPVRNSGHWLQTFLKAYSLTHDRRFEDAANRISRMLLRPELRPGGHTFHYRTAAGKDGSSGLIGQAWTLESLACAWGYFHTQEHLVLALDLFRAHPFDQAHGLWEIRDVDGSLRGFDKTFNHQLWFAAAASRFLDAGLPDVRLAVEVFLERVPQNMVLFPNGLIYHDSILQVESRKRRLKTMPTRVLGSRLFPRSLLRHRGVASVSSLYLKSVGYHAFCAHGFATLKLNVPSHGLWQSSSVDRVVNYLQSPEYASLIGIERYYGFPYNAPGFEVPFAVSTLLGMPATETAQLVSTWVTAQALRTFNPQSGRFDKGTPDPATLTARIYEMSSLPDDVLRAAVLGTLSS
jgi:hypothetical protein